MSRKKALGNLCAQVLKSTPYDKYCPVRRAMESGEDQAATGVEMIVVSGGLSINPDDVARKKLH